MAAIRKRHLDLLRPYLASEEPSLRGEDQHRELDMYCPLHEDTKRSATVDLDKGLWYCHAGCGGGRVVQLIRQQEDWVPAPNGGANGKGAYRSKGKGGSAPSEEITEAKVRGWMQALMSNEDALERIMTRRGLDEEILTAYEIGYDQGRQAYTIPVRDHDGTILNLRRYQFDPPDERRKIWSVNGMGQPRLYPISTLTDDQPDEIIVCAGEWDALLTIQNGFHAVTRTASETTWASEWGEYFREKVVYLCHDADKTGQAANRKVAKLLTRVAKDVRVVQLPYEVVDKNGKDLTDYWMEGHEEDDFRKLLEEATPADPVKEVVELDPTDAKVLDTFDSRRVGEPLRVTVTIKGKRDPGYTVPKKFGLTCTRDAGHKCNFCPLNAAGGESTLGVEPSDPLVLELIESTKGQVEDAARRTYGAPKCSKLTIESLEHQAVEVLFARPSVEHTEGRSDEYKNIKITSVGRHDTMPNNTVRVVGALHPDPRKQMNEFLAWQVDPIQTSLDGFELNAKEARSLQKFTPRKGQKPLQKLGVIARDLEAHVTKIYGRPEMHAAMDLVFHSVLAFDFGGQRIGRGWLDALFVGDTRTGKSEAAEGLVRHYRVGEVVNCESASFAGIVGGLQQYGGGKEWAINWGAIPINDRRLVVLDEISGLAPEQIAAMSDVRSRGIAQLTKIQQEATHARTRLIWIGNPRDARMGDFTYGVQAIRPLIGNPEDIARFDIAMSASAGEVSAEEINRVHEVGAQKYNTEECTMLIRWVWSRTPEQIKWSKTAERAVYETAQQLGSRYVEDPPLVQVANVRIKVARLAVALAARLFSTDSAHECILVKREHVLDAVAFLDRIYNMPGFGYAELSRERISDRQEARAKRDDILKWLRGRRGLAKFLRSNGTFRRQDLEEIMNVGREEANAIINTLWEARMVYKNRGDVRVEPALHELLREVRH